MKILNVVIYIVGLRLDFGYYFGIKKTKIIKTETYFIKEIKT